MGSASLVLHDVSVTFADDTDSLRARQAPYVCFKLGPKGESSQQTECIKNAGREVVWHQVQQPGPALDTKLHLSVLTQAQLGPARACFPQKLRGLSLLFYPVPAQRTISVTQKGKEKQLSVKKFVLDKKLAGSTFDAWVYIVGSRAEPAHRSREESKELRHDKALLKGLMKRSRLPLTLIHTTADLGPATCKKALKATKDYNAAVFHLPAEGGVGLNGPGQPLDPLCAYLHPWASPAEAAKATVPCLHARVATNILDAGKDGTKAGLEGAAEAIFVEVGVTITKELAHTAAEHVLQEASAIVATQVVEYVLPAIGAIVTVAMLPHTYAKIHRMVTCMAYTYHEQWAFTSSLPLPMVYEALSMNQPDLAVHLQKAMKLEQQQEYDSPDDLISTQWRTLPQYARSSAPAPTYPSREAPTHGSESVHPRAGMSAPGDDSPIDFDTLFLYKSQAVTQAEMDHLEREGPADLIRAFKTKPVSTVMAADGTPVATWPFSNVDHNAHKWGEGSGNGGSISSSTAPGDLQASCLPSTTKWPASGAHRGQGQGQDQGL
ncbi:hypothetical protein WJX84_002212 [Apatococcus fuscideae]|uniref:C2 domain-containing protein n=1 Tax=Apatococcus fuscideae TaxID=2026836 RepID=A0AAW1SVM4_9CHLO